MPDNYYRKLPQLYPKLRKEMTEQINVKKVFGGTEASEVFSYICGRENIFRNIFYLLLVRELTN
jgi:hypothetical protein